MNTSLENKNIILGITGSIAAYKAAEIASLLSKSGAHVWPVMTPSALKFVTTLTIGTLAQKPVATEFWEEDRDWQPGHIQLADRADLLLVAPATANIIASFAHGLTSDLLSAIYLATRAKVLIAPAMNGKMFQHAATQENIRLLRQRGHVFIGPDSGMQACGYDGPGRLASPEAIVAKAGAMLATPADLYEQNNS